METNAPQLLERYLTERGLFEPTDVVKAIVSGRKDVPVGEEILGNEELLAQCAGIYQNNYKTLEAVIRARIYPLVIELVMRAYPQETIVIRQSILEIAAILDDFKKYSDEYTRRTEIKNRGGGGGTPATVSPPASLSPQ